MAERQPSPSGEPATWALRTVEECQQAASRRTPWVVVWRANQSAEEGHSWRRVHHRYTAEVIARDAARRGFLAWTEHDEDATKYPTQR